MMKHMMPDLPNAPAALLRPYFFFFMVHLATCDLGTIYHLDFSLPAAFLGCTHTQETVAAVHFVYFVWCMCLQHDYLHIGIFSGKVRQILFLFIIIKICYFYLLIR